MNLYLLHRYVSILNKNVTDVPLNDLKELHLRVHNELRYLWHHGFVELLTYLSEKYMTGVYVSHCEPYLLWLAVPKTSFNYFRKVVVKSLDELCQKYPLLVRTFAYREAEEELVLIPYSVFREEESNRKAEIGFVFGIDIPHEDYWFFARHFDGHPGEKPVHPDGLLKDLMELTIHEYDKWPPKGRDDLPGGDHWPSLFSFPDYKEIESRTLPRVLEEIPE